MKTDLFRTRQILTKDRMMNISSLPDIISSEVGEVLSYILDIKSCNTKVNVSQNGSLEIFVSINADGVKRAKSI